jgi:hypothetical protein
MVSPLLSILESHHHGAYADTIGNNGPMLCLPPKFRQAGTSCSTHAHPHAREAIPVLSLRKAFLTPVCTLHLDSHTVYQLADITRRREVMFLVDTQLHMCKAMKYQQ